MGEKRREANCRRAMPGWVVSLALAPAVLARVHAMPLEIPHPPAEITIDAEIVEPAWEHALVLTLDYETRPGENVAPPVHTEALLLDTGDALVVAFRAYDPEPGRIRAFFRDRDSLFGDDFVGVKLDTFNDQRRALQFFVNPYGAQLDTLLFAGFGETTLQDDSVNEFTPTAHSLFLEVSYAWEPRF